MNLDCGVSGTTRLIVAIGDPVAQVKAPEVFNRYCAERGLDVCCIPMHVAPAGLAAAMESFRALHNLIGLSVTIPHKGTVVPHIDRLSERAKRLRVVNAVRREPDGSFVGDIFDGEGFAAGLRHQGIAVTGANVLLVGAGGAGTAIAFALFDAGIGHLTLRDLDPGRAAALAARLVEHWPGRATAGDSDPRRFDIAVNASPCGLRPDDEPPFDPAELRPDAVVADIIMEPAVTKLVTAAKGHGCRIHPGRHMFDHQVRLYADFLRLESERRIGPAHDRQP
jgi:shikimate dehydrogenase